MLVSCSKDEQPQEINYGAQEAGDIALVLYNGNGAKKAVNILTENNLITGAYDISDSDDNNAELIKALDRTKDGAIVYFVVDCSYFSGQMPESEFFRLKEMWSAWQAAQEEQKVKNILPVWVVNVNNEEEAQDIFGMSMGKGWYILTSYLYLPKFSIGENISDSDFKNVIPVYAPYRFSEDFLSSLKNNKEHNKTKSSDPSITISTQVSSFKKEINLQYYVYQPRLANGMWESGFSATWSTPKYTHKGLPSEEIRKNMVKDGGVIMDTKFTIEIAYVPGIKEKIIKVKSEGGYQVFLGEMTEKPLCLGYSGKASINYILKNYTSQVKLTLEDGTIEVIDLVPNVTKVNYELSEEKDHLVTFETLGKVDDPNFANNTQISYDWQSKEDVKYNLQDFAIKCENNINDRSATAKYTFSPDKWYGKNAFNTYLSGELTGKLNLAALLQEIISPQFPILHPLTKGKELSPSNYKLNEGAKQIAIYHVRNSDGKILIKLSSSISFDGGTCNYIFGKLIPSFIGGGSTVTSEQVGCDSDIVLDFGEPKVLTSTMN